MHPSRVEQVLARKQLEHTELNHNPTWPEILEILRRERIQLVHGALPAFGWLVGFLGTWTIIISSETAKARWNYVALHELAHLWLHQDPVGRDEECFAFGCDTTDDREIDAENFVSMIMNPECWK